MFPLPASEPVASLDDYSLHLTEALHKAHEAARKTLRSTQERMKRDYDLKVHVRGVSGGG